MPERRVKEKVPVTTGVSPRQRSLRSLFREKECPKRENNFPFVVSFFPAFHGEKNRPERPTRSPTAPHLPSHDCPSWLPPLKHICRESSNDRRQRRKRRALPLEYCRQADPQAGNPKGSACLVLPAGQKTGLPLGRGFFGPPLSPGYCMSKAITRPDSLPHATLQKIF